MRGDAVVTLAVAHDAALADARARAHACRCAAAQSADALVSAAYAEARAFADRRRAASERLADLEREARLAAARAQARATVLRARQSVIAEATAAAHAAAHAVVCGPRYESMIERLAAETRERLASSGTVQIVQVPAGGLVARAGSREIDYSLDAQVDRCLAALAGEIDRLWQ